MRYLLALLILTGCADDIARAQAGLGSDGGAVVPTSSRILEAQLQDAIEASGLSNTGMLIERDDGRRVWLANGTPNERYISSSTSKPVMVAAMLDQIAQGRLTLRTKAIDVLPGFAANAAGGETRIEVRHLLALRSGMYLGPLCWQQPDQASFAACIDALPLSCPDLEPDAFHYSTQHLDIAGQMFVVAGGYADFGAVFDEWRGRTGLFPGATWNPAFRRSAGVQINITATEYLDFLDAIRDCSILPNTVLGRSLCAAMQSDQMSGEPARNITTFPLWQEDWHIGYDLWLECQSLDWSCPNAARISSWGIAGQYGLIEREHGYRAVITPSFTGQGQAGIMYARSVAPLLETWASLAVQP